MRIVAVSGSPKLEGVTNSVILDILEKGAHKGHFGKVVVLNRWELHGCQACRYCRTEGDRCAIDDDMSKLLEDIREADMVIVGSPVYMGYVSAQLKMFLDRLYSLKDKERKPRLAPKRCILVLSQGAEDREHYKDMAAQVKKLLDSANLIVEDTIIAAAPDYGKSPEVTRQIEEICSRL